MSKNTITLQPIECDNIIIKCILNCEKLCNDENKEYINTFKIIVPYGDPSKPYFMASCVFKFLNNNEMNSNRKLKENYIQDLHYIKAKILDKKVAVNMLSTKGVMKAMYVSKAPIAICFQNYIHELLDNLWKTKSELIEIEMKTIEDKLKLSERQMDKTNFLLEGIQNISDFGDSKQKELTILRRKYMKSFALYIVDWQYVNNIITAKKTKSYDSDSDSDKLFNNNAIDEYDYRYITFNQINDPTHSDDYYFYIPENTPSHRLVNNIKHIGYLYFESVEHFHDFKSKFIGTFRERELHNIILNTYFNIIDMNECLFIEKNKEFLIRQ